MKKSGIAKSPASPSSNTQRTRGSAPKIADFDPTSRPQRAGGKKASP